MFNYARVLVFFAENDKLYNMEKKSFEKEWETAVSKDESNKIRSVSESIYKAYFRLLFKVSYAILLNQQDAEDVVQESFISFFSRPNNSKKVSNIKYYLLNTAKYLSYKQRSREKIFVEFDEEKADKIFEVPVDLLSLSPTTKDGKAVLTELEANIVIQHLECGLSFREIGQSMNKTVDSISGIYRKAIGKLKKIYREEKR